MPLEDISATGTSLVLGDDTAVAVPLPFTFTFFGQPRTSVFVSSNGLLRFAPFGADSNPTCGLPRVDGPNGLIAAFWEDLDPSKGGGVFWQVDGAPGARRFIAQWKDVPHFRSAAFASIPAGSHTFEVILHETTNRIELRYGKLAGAPESDGSNATAGVESADGREGVAVSCKTAGILAEGVRFTFTEQPFAPAFAWRDPATSAVLATGPSRFLPAEGTCTVELETRANDPLGLCPLTDSRLITVPDIAPPRVAEGSGDLHCIWPPNHALVTFTSAQFAPAITDNCSPFTWVISSCVSDQPQEGKDCMVAPDGGSIQVRAERAGGDPAGRRYAVGIIATDGAGNRGAETRIGYIYVPHDQSPGTDCIRGETPSRRALRRSWQPAGLPIGVTAPGR